MFSAANTHHGQHKPGVDLLQAGLYSVSASPCAVFKDGSELVFLSKLATFYHNLSNK